MESSAVVYDLGFHFGKRTIDSTLIWTVRRSFKAELVVRNLISPALQAVVKAELVVNLRVRLCLMLELLSRKEKSLRKRVKWRKRQGPSKLLDAIFFRVIKESSSNGVSGCSDGISCDDKISCFLVNEPSFRRLFDLASKVPLPKH
jgi:hypothetical protein